jgi:hypothetical protein
MSGILSTKRDSLFSLDFESHFRRSSRQEERVVTVLFGKTPVQMYFLKNIARNEKVLQDKPVQFIFSKISHGWESDTWQTVYKFRPQQEVNVLFKNVTLYVVYLTR